MPGECGALRVAGAPLGSQPGFQPAHVWRMGARLSPGPRTVPAALRVMGWSHDAPWQPDQRGLHRARWSGLTTRQGLRGVLVSAVAATGTRVVGRDDTSARRRGEQHTAPGRSREPGRSAHAHCVQASGGRGLGWRLLVERPWAARGWALPWRTALGPAEHSCKERGRAHRPRPARARQRRPGMSPPQRDAPGRWGVRASRASVCRRWSPGPLRGRLQGKR